MLPQKARTFPISSLFSRASDGETDLFRSYHKFLNLHHRLARLRSDFIRPYNPHGLHQHDLFSLNYRKKSLAIPTA